MAGLFSVGLAYALVLLGGGAPFALTGAAWALAVGASAVLAAMLALAARRRGTTPPALKVTIVLVFLATLGGLGWALAAPSPVAGGPLLLGLPRVTAVMLIVTGALPLLVLPLVYALRFDRDVLSDADVEGLRDG